MWSPLEILLLILASYRLTHILVFDKIAAPIRARFPGKGWTGYLVRCYWCAGVWLSTLVVALYALWPAGGRWVVLAFAVAGGQAGLETFFRGWERTKPVGGPGRRPTPEAVRQSPDATAPGPNLH